VPKLTPEIRDALRRLSIAKPAVFGADSHQFILNPPLPEDQLKSFEQNHRFSLPDDYRDFISKIGNGGAGPYHGVFPLGIDASDFEPRPWRERDGLVGVLSAPFPLREPWNDLTGMPPDDLLDADEDEYDRQRAVFESRHWRTAIVNGAFPICHIGCALRIWLVLTGDEAGRLWRDGRADLTGLSPVRLSDGSPAIFSSWYREWLDGCLIGLQSV
jgi:SMI1/KNR4 family protein SUKH-1